MANARLRPVNELSDDPLDETLKESFPASDPPSFTPGIGVGNNESAYASFSEGYSAPEESDTNSAWKRRPGKMPAGAIAGGIAAIAGIWFSVWMLRRRHRTSKTEQVRDMANRAWQPVVREARKRAA